METPVMLSPEDEKKLGEIEATLKELDKVGSAIDQLFDIRRIGFLLSDFEKDKQKELLGQEDGLRKRLKELGGPSWESHRRWA